MLNTPFHVPTLKANRRREGLEQEREAIAALIRRPRFSTVYFDANEGAGAAKRELTSKTLARVNHGLLTILH